MRALFTDRQIVDFAGMQASGKPIDIMTIDSHRSKDGKVIKVWQLENLMAAVAS